MAIDTLTDLNNLITNGTGAERLAFKNIIVNGLNSQDLADIITSSTREQKEALASLIVQAEDFLIETTAAAAAAQRVIDLATAQSWWDTTIEPTVLWNNSQPLVTQRANILLDFEMAKGLLQTETDKFRLEIINQKIVAGNTKFKEIKAAINTAGG